MVRRHLRAAGVICVLVIAVTRLWGQAPPPKLLLDPTVVSANSLASLTAAVHLGPSAGDVLSTSVVLLRVDAAGRTIATIGPMNDDGITPDSSAGDSFYTTSFSVMEANGPLYYRVSYATRGSVRRNITAVTQVEVTPPGIPTSPLVVRSITNTVDVGNRRISCDDIVVSFSPDVVPVQAVAIISSLGAVAIGRLPAIGLFQVRLPTCSAAALTSALAAFRSHPLVTAADVTAIHSSTQTSTPTDPLFSQQWALPKLRLPEAWAVRRNAVNVGLLDTGVNYSHEDLAGRIVKGRDFIDGDDDPADDQGHGTNVAGIIAAVSNNGKGITGAAFQGKVVAERVCGGVFGRDCPDPAVYLGIIDAITRRAAKVLNLSFADYEKTLTMERAIQYALDNDVVVIAAAGNDDTSQLTYPSSFSDVVSVAASDRNDERSMWCGSVPCFFAPPKERGSNYGSRIDVYAPGTDIYYTRHDGIDQYGSGNGTSYAAPFVAAIAALMRAANPSLAVKDVRSLLKSTARNTGKLDGSPENREVAVADAYEAVRAALAPQPMLDSNAIYGQLRDGFTEVGSTYGGWSWSPEASGTLFTYEYSPSDNSYRKSYFTRHQIIRSLTMKVRRSHDNYQYCQSQKFRAIVGLRPRTNPASSLLYIDSDHVAIASANTEVVEFPLPPQLQKYYADEWDVVDLHIGSDGGPSGDCTVWYQTGWGQAGWVTGPHYWLNGFTVYGYRTGPIGTFEPWTIWK